MGGDNGAAAAAGAGRGGGGGDEVPDATVVSIDGVEFVKQREGEAEILQPGNKVFYNKAQVRRAGAPLLPVLPPLRLRAPDAASHPDRRSPGPPRLSNGALVCVSGGGDTRADWQVVNRDLSLAVLREFAAVRRRELAGDCGEEAQKAARKRNYKNCMALKIGAAGMRDKGPRFGAEMAASILEASYPRSFEAFSEERPGEARGEGGAPGKEAKEGKEVDEAEREREEQREELRKETDTRCPDLVICEALAASGLRAIRYAKELGGDVGRIIANDADQSAVAAIERNARHNGAVAEAKIVPQFDDARMLLMRHERCFDVVDIDPYGSPNIFLEPAVQAVNEGGLLCVTATDMAVLCGGSGEACWSKYGSYPVKGKYCHEYAVRTLLHAVEAAANRYKRHIVPVMSLSIDFYVRVFARVYTSPSAVKLSGSKMSYVFQSTGCDSFYLQPVARVLKKNGANKYTPGVAPAVPEACPETGRSFHLGGPIWSEPIHDMAWVRSIRRELERNRAAYPGYDKVHGFLVAASEELADVPLYVSIHSMAATLKCEPPNLTLFRSAIINAGYRVSISHASALAVKTDAPMRVLWDIMRCWVKEHPIKNPEKYAGTPGGAILAREPELVANWARARGAISHAKEKKIARFVPNPEENWGPMSRAGRDNNEANRGKTKRQRVNEAGGAAGPE